MSFHAISRDEDRVEPVLPPPLDSARTSHSRSHSESKHLLTSPRNIFEYSTTQALPFGYPVLHDVVRSPPRHVEPQTLRKRRKEWFQETTTNILMAGSSLPFFAVAAAVMRLHGMVLGRNQHYDLEQLIRGAATLFPLVYSVVVGRATIKLAGWLLERGTTLGLLERLMGSQTVGGTIITQWRLRSLSLLGFSLVALWSLSPLGGQAVLRILSTSIRPISTPAEITYINTRQPSYAGSLQFVTTWFPGFATLFSASLLAPEAIKNSSMDLWGNVKIPYFSSLLGVPEDSNGWRQITPEIPLIYSSLFGIPVSGIPVGNTTFDMQSTYLDLICTNIVSNQTRDPLDPLIFYNPGLISANGPFEGENITSSTPWALGYFGPDITPFLPPEILGSLECLDCLPENFTSMTFDGGLLLYQDLEGLSNVTTLYCVPRQVYIESKILCSNTPGRGQSCTVIAQRPSTLPHMPTTLTHLNFHDIFLGLAALLPQCTQQISYVDLMQNYIYNPTSNTFIQSAQWPGHSNITGTSESRFLDISFKDFGDRLGQIINAFLYGSMFNSTQFLTGAPFDYMEDWVDHPASFDPATSDAAVYNHILNQTSAFTVPGNVTNATEIYVCSWPWMALFLFATSALPVAAIVAAILQRKTLAREYMGYVSSLVRESRHVNVAKGGVALDGMERTRSLMGLRVRFGDVGDVDGGVPVDSGIGVVLSVGQLALGDEESTRRVDERKLYV